MTCLLLRKAEEPLAVRLPAGFPKDPADRLIAATAIVEGVPLVTADERIRQAKVVQAILVGLNAQVGRSRWGVD